MTVTPGSPLLLVLLLLPLLPFLAPLSLISSRCSQQGKTQIFPPPPPRSLVSRFLHSLELCHVRRLFSQEKKKHKNSDGDQAVCGSFYNTGEFPLLGFLLRFKNGIVQLSFAEPELLIFRHLLSFIPPTLPMQTRL